MKVQLIQGEYNTKDTIDLITQLIHIKIKYHESKISSESNEEDIKFRESKIQRLQKELYELRKILSKEHKNLKLNSTIDIEF